MTEATDRLANLSPAKRALLERRLAQGAGTASAPPAAGGGPTPERIAIVSAACRLPGGANTPEAFWQMLVDGRDAVTDVPPDRWDGEALLDADPLAANRMVSRRGAFLDGIDRFDAAFFGISPREAALMDPQQRLLLELAWEALEAGGQPVDQMAGAATGVFVGAHSHSSDYWLLQLAQREGLESHSATGSAHSILANRISYAFDLRGPSMAVDTACSSSLVAVHLACQSLRSGECDLALAGGVNLMLLPSASLAFSKLQILSPDGRCASFDASANGIARGEGAALVVLKRLADALRDGDPVLAVVAGSAVNQDGASNGLTAPSGPAQEAVVRRALAMAGIPPHRYGLVETHGTGTPLGDPVEVEALARVIGAPRDAAHRCWLGAVKTNIGHLEAAAGIAGLVKVIGCLREGQVPGNLHFVQPNPHLRLQGTPFEIPRGTTPWPAGDQPRVAGVSSFGFGGTNAHLVLEEFRPPPLAAAAAPPSGEDWLPISARTPAALAEAMRAAAEALRKLPASGLRDFAHTARQRRSHHAYRVALHGTTPQVLADQIEARLAAGGLPSASPLAGAEPRAVWVYSGQGGLWPGMGRELYAGEPVFRTALDEVAAAFRSLAGWDLRPALTEADPDGRLAATEVAQPVLFALQVGLTALWRSFGLECGAIVGHSVGEVAAAHAAGVLTLDDAVRVVFERSRAMQPAMGHGRMAQVECDEATVREELAAALAADGGLSIAALNGPASTVLAGAAAPLQAGLARLQQRGVASRMLAVDYAFHSAQMQPFVPGIQQALTGVAPRAAGVPLISTVTARWADASQGDHGAAYWGRNVRETVRFAPALAALFEAGFGAFLEIGPHPSLGSGILATAEALGRGAVVAASLRRAQPANLTLLSGLCTLYEAGAAIDWRALRQPGRRVLTLPAYPWQRQRHWIDAPDAGALALSVTGQAGVPAPPVVATVPACYEMAWREACGPRPTGAPPFDIGATALSLQAEAAGWPQAGLLADEAGLHTQMERRGAELARQALRSLGIEAGLHVSAADAATWGVLSRHQRLWQRLLQMAAAAGWLEPDAGQPANSDAPAWRVAASALQPPAEPPTVARTEFALMERCGAQLGAVLRGECDPLALLFPADGRDSAAEVYSQTVSAQFYNRLAAEAVAGLARSARRPLRVLEIGAGTGGTTATLLPTLPEGGEYTFTDLSPHFLHEAQARFGGAAQRFTFRRLDIETAPQTQGFELASFDLVVAANVLHATAHLARTVAHVRSLLAPGGVLVLLETVQRRAWTDLTFGLTEGWWRHADAPLRQDDVLLGATQWQSLLADSGFDDVRQLGAEVSAHSVHAQAVLLARAARAADDAPARHRFVGTTWQVVADRGGFGERLAAALRAEGATCTVFAAGAEPRPADAHLVGGIVHCGALDSPPAGALSLETLGAALGPGIGSALAWVRQLSQTPPTTAGRPEPEPDAARVWLVTRGAQSVSSVERDLAPAQALLWGLGRSVALERPARWGGLVDLDPGASDEANIAALLHRLAAGDGEDQVAVRGGVTRVARLVARPRPAPAALALDDRGSVLVTGGFGGLGHRIADWLARQGARHLVLIGRNGPRTGAESDESRAAIDRLRAGGVEIVTARADVSDAVAMRSLFERLAAEGHAVRGIVHAAASIRFQALDSLGAAELDDALRAKVHGAWVLHELTRDLRGDRALQFFALFSSATSLMGAKGLAAYAAANQFLAALAAHRASLGLPATCIDWGAWSEIRLLGRDQADISRLGHRPMADKEAFGLLAALVHAGVPSCMVADIDWSTAAAAYQAHGRRPFLDECPARHSDEGEAPIDTAAAETRTHPGSANETADELRAVLEPLDTRGRRERLAAVVRRELARVLGLAGPQAVDPAKGFFELGLDSLMAMQLRRRLGDATGLALSATVTFNHPSVWPLADHLLERLGLAPSGADPAAAASPAASPSMASGTRPNGASAPDGMATMSDDEVRRALLSELSAAGLLDDDDGAAGGAR